MSLSLNLNILIQAGAQKGNSQLIVTSNHSFFPSHINFTNLW